MKKSKAPEVEVQITPMLDMAFQLLTFFILTYRAMPSEGQFAMNLLPAAPALNEKVTAPPKTETNPNPDIPAMLKTLTTQIHANADGSLGRVTIEEVEVKGMDQLRDKLKEIFDNKDLPFEQVLIQADPQLKYEELVKVIDVFSSQKITKISFSELDPNSANAGVAL